METSRPLVPLTGTGPRQRAADADRTAVCEELAIHYAAGRLREDELDARLSAAVGAVTLLELRRLVEDLPHPAPALPAARSWSVLDILAVLTVVGSLAFAGVMVVLLGVAAPAVLVLSCFFGGCVAAAGGAAVAHLAHRAGQRSQLRAQRPRIA